MKAHTTRSGRDALSNYELPHRIHAAKVYPSKSPNGSTIIIYGHENGVRICWRGGRPLKPTVPGQVQVNGTRARGKADATETDDEAELEPEFESDDEELDDSNPAPSIIQTLDLALHTEVLHVSTPPVPAPSPLRPAEMIPPVFADNIVFAIACADCSIRVISVPKMPPSNARKAPKKLTRRKPRFGEEVVVIGSQIGHQSIPRGLSMTWTVRDSGASPVRANDEEDQDMDLDESAAVAPGKPQTSFQFNDLEADTTFDLIIASHSVEGTGVVHIFRVPLAPAGENQSKFLGPTPPFQTLYLPGPAISAVFSPNAYPNKRHTQLLVSDSKGFMRTYDPFLPPEGERASILNDDQGKRQEGSWLASFGTSFKTSRSDFSCPGTAQRKRILDAQWATEGRSVVALLADGEWGIWDIEGSAPPASAKSASNSSFAIGGFVGSSAARPSSSGGGSFASSKSGSGLAPMTPNTRRTKQDSFIHGTSGTSSSTSPYSARGGVSVSSIASTTGGVSEDSVIIWYNNEVYRIPNLAQYWARSASGSSGGLYSPGLSRVEGISLRGQMINSIDQFDIAASAAKLAVPRDLLIAAQHRLLVLARVGAHRRDDGPSVSLFDHASSRGEDDVDMVDRALLARGELDLGGMDRLLDSMAAGQTTAATSRRVGFAA